MKLEGCEKISYVLKTKKNQNKNKTKKILLQPGSNPGRPHGNSNVTTTAPANNMFKIESSFYIITNSSLLNSNQKPLERLLPSEDFKNRKYILVMVAQPIFDLKSIDFTPK